MIGRFSHGKTDQSDTVLISLFFFHLHYPLFILSIILSTQSLLCLFSYSSIKIKSKASKIPTMNLLLLEPDVIVVEALPALQILCLVESPPWIVMLKTNRANR